MIRKNNFLKASYVLRKDVSNEDIQSMFQIFLKYYDNTEFKTFIRDLNKKDGVFIVRRKDNGRIVGFSTGVRNEFELPTRKGKKKKAVALFSGDTIMEKAYWGNTALQLAAAKYAITQKIKNLQKPVFWFLICKGFKTYLLMANNLISYWPRVDKEDDPQGNEIVEKLCLEFFPDNYDAESGLLLFGEKSQKLKSNVAEITEELKEKYPKIGFFEKKNPTWRNGTELPCVAELSVFNLLYGSLRQVMRLVKAMWWKKETAG